jgi:hypothetical protein
VVVVVAEGRDCGVSSRASEVATEAVLLVPAPAREVAVGFLSAAAISNLGSGFEEVLPTVGIGVGARPGFPRGVFRGL